MAFQKGNVNSAPTKNNRNPIYLKITATITHTNISKKYIFNALKFKEIDSKIVLFIKNIIGATKMVMQTQITAKIMVGAVNLKIKYQKM